MCSRVKPGLRRWLKGKILKHVYGMVTCKEFEDFVMRYLDGELTAKQNRKFKLHLMLCRECRDYLSAYKRSIELSRELLRNPVTSDSDKASEELIQKVLADKNH